MSDTLPPLVDPVRLERWLNDALPGSGEISVERHLAGHSNETFFVTRGNERWVLRRPPRGAFLPSAHDVGREYRVLTGLARANVRAPKPLLMCEEESVIGAQFYLMERVDGIVIRDQLPQGFDPNDHRAIGGELVDALVELHDVDPIACGLDALGKGSGYLERQLRRWYGQLELTLPHTRPVPVLHEVMKWLQESVPESGAVTIVHGDYKLDNAMFTVDTPTRLVAILDWEMCTLGDPLADLGWMVTCWREAGDDPNDWFARISRVTEASGFASRNDLIERYASHTGRDVTSLDWYRVLAIFKLAILLEGSFARHLAGLTDDPFFADLDGGVPALAARALEIARS